nr:hypothetical protein [Tanacetum cinerariifolium]
MSLRGPSLKGSSKKEDVKPVSGTNLAEVIEKETSTVKPVINEDEVILPSSLLHDETERQGYEEAGREAEKKDKTEITSSKKKNDAKKNTSKIAESNKPAIGSPKSRVKGMVKDFFKLSNQESPPKAKTNVVSGGLSSRWKTNSKSRTQEEVVISKPNLLSRLPSVNVEMAPDDSNTSKLPKENVKMAPDASSTKPLDSNVPAGNVKVAPTAPSTIPLDSKVPTDNVNTMPDASYKVTENDMKPNMPKFPQNRTIRKLEDITFQKDASPASVTLFVSVSQDRYLMIPDSKANAENIDDPSLDNFQVEELAPVEEKDSNTQEESEAFKVLDSKIHMWSSGRKGNIRSLLSTLQLVLWAGSGWKPVALVDIIEANAVKKSYNRAMLCLHPDKLQQKGADAQKKYTAEKVFDILQEAWDHFNTLGTLL